MLVLHCAIISSVGLPCVLALSLFIVLTTFVLSLMKSGFIHLKRRSFVFYIIVLVHSNFHCSSQCIYSVPSLSFYPSIVFSQHQVGISCFSLVTILIVLQYSSRTRESYNRTNVETSPSRPNVVINF